MGYWLGVDIGTTFTAAAVCAGGRAEPVGLGNRTDEVPSLVFVGADGGVVVGEVAGRRAAAEPERVAREFKRRVGDPIPVLLGGAPYPVHALMARMLEYVLTRVTADQEAIPTGVVLTHPASWGPFKQDLLRQAARIGGVPEAHLRSEPECAAVMYAAGERMNPGEIVAVYDLGGGTFDAAVLSKTADGFVLLGQPEGIEQLGGVDFDDAVFHHVLRALGDDEQFDPFDEAVRSGLQRLRRDCVDAKEFLSYDSVATIPVTLPKLHTSVRIHQSELEEMVRPALLETIGALRRALRSAGVAPEQLRSVLLAGGSSRIPLVKNLIVSEIGCPVVLGSHPKQGVALGAATLGAAIQPAFPRPAAPSRQSQPAQRPRSSATHTTPSSAAAVGKLTDGRPSSEPVRADDSQAAGPDGVVLGPGPRSSVSDRSMSAPRSRKEVFHRRRSVMVAGAAVAVAAIITTVVLLTNGPSATGPSVPGAVGSTHGDRTIQASPPGSLSAGLVAISGALVSSRATGSEGASTSGRPTQEYTVSVSSRITWTDTRTVLTSGDVVRFTSSGQISDDQTRPNQLFTADGAPRDPKNDVHNRDPYLQFPHAALLGRIGAKGAPFYVGRALRIQGTGQGEIYLGVNDFNLADNHGMFSVRIDVS